jgi:D-methionine transport system ATP-binding protein
LTPAGAAGVLTLLDRARAELGTTVALLTTDATAAAKVADQVALLRDGRIVGCADVLGLAAQPDGPLADALLPPLDPIAPEVPAPREHLLDAVLVGHATLRGLTEAMAASGVDAALLAGGRTWFGDTPIARYRIGVDGPAAHSLLSWLARHASHLRAAAPATLAYAA